MLFPISMHFFLGFPKFSLPCLIPGRTTGFVRHRALLARASWGRQRVGFYLWWVERFPAWSFDVVFIAKDGCLEIRWMIPINLTSNHQKIVQTWPAGKSTIEFDDFSINTSI
jgi:hypothetical protein